MRTFAFAVLILGLLLTGPHTTAQEPARLPKVVLIGDSIRIGYAPVVAKQLEGKAVVVSPKANGGDSANVLAKLAHGLADDALSCIALALRPKAPVLIAPAMNGKMWLHPATQQNVETLKGRGIHFIGPEEGMRSCGYW